MITRLYANNFRCLVAFEAKFDSFGVLCGPNGAGKSSVIDVLKLLRDLATGDAYLGGEGEKDIRQLEFTKWLKITTQEFELEVTAKGHNFQYRLGLEQFDNDEKPRVFHERAVCDGRELFIRDLEGVRFQKWDGSQGGFPLDWRRAALGAIQPNGPLSDIQILQDALARLLVLRPNPRGMEPESKSESRSPSFHLTNLTSWYRSLSQEQDWTDVLRQSLQTVWPDFKSFKLVDAGLNTKALQLRFDGVDTFFHQLSDGEKSLVGLYMIRAALETNAAGTVVIDEPDNYVGLPELQPWVLCMRELLDEQHQAILISHHPEILGNVGETDGIYLWRDSHRSPTRIGQLKVPEGLSPAEAIARGWANG
jgi:energy-coupling factor transporter ATP-binding protein EcfA2